MTNGRPARRTVPARFALQDTDASVAAHDPPPTPAQPAESYGRMCGGLMPNGRPARRTVPARFALQDTDASVAAHDPPPTPAQPAESYGRMCGGLMRPSHMTPITPRTRHTTHDIPRTTRRLDFPQTAPIVDKAAARQADAGWSSSVARWAHNPEVHGSNPCPATLDFPQTAPIVDKAAARQADAGWSSSVARWAHNPEVHGSNPCPATNASGFTSRNPEAFSISSRFQRMRPLNF